MATHTLQTGLPPLPIAGGMQLKLEAVSPTTGLAITGVTVTDWSIYGYDESGRDIPLVVPHWVAEDVGSG